MKVGETGRRGVGPYGVVRNRQAVRICGRGKPLPYGDGRTRGETNTGHRGRRPLRGGANIRRGAWTAGGASPSPTEADGRGAKPTRDVEDAVPYGVVRSRGAVRRPREGQAPPLRGGANIRRGAWTAGGASPSPTGWCEAVRRCVDRGTSRTPSPTGSAKMGSPDGKSHFLILSLIRLSCRAFLIPSRRRPARAATGQILQCPRRCARRWG